MAARGPSSPAGPRGSAASALVDLNGGLIGQVFDQLKLVGHQLVTREALRMPRGIRATGRGTEAVQWRAAVHAFKTDGSFICLPLRMPIGRRTETCGLHRQRHRFKAGSGDKVG